MKFFPVWEVMNEQGAYKSGCTEKVRKFCKKVRNLLSFLSQFKGEIQIFNIFRILSIGGTEKVLKFSIEDGTEFLGNALKKYR